MSAVPPPHLLQRLARRRLSVPRTGTRGGVGEHASLSRGAGIEFAEHREYQPGDDLRRLDPHLEARTGEPYVREFEVLERLAVTVVADLSASMAFGQPEKATAARRLTGALAFVGLAGADRTRVAVFTGSGLRWGPQAGNVRAAGRLFDWLGRQQAGGAVDFGSVAKELAGRVPRPGLVIVVSDWLFDDPLAGVRSLRAAGQEVVALQLLAPEEVEPADLRGGTLTLQDSETGEELQVTLDAATLQRYQQSLAERQQRLLSAFAAAGATWLSARTDADLEQLLLVEGTRLGFLR
ncbi:MAG: DUF58 domain-containing protein [Trueperaceae bacterium]